MGAVPNPEAHDVEHVRGQTSVGIMKAFGGRLLGLVGEAFEKYPFGYEYFVDFCLWKNSCIMHHEHLHNSLRQVVVFGFAGNCQQMSLDSVIYNPEI